MTSIILTISTENLRRVDGCESERAIAALVRAAEMAAGNYRVETMPATIRVETTDGPSLYAVTPTVRAAAGTDPYDVAELESEAADLAETVSLAITDAIGSLPVGA